jgi:hypothetical protein
MMVHAQLCIRKAISSLNSRFAALLIQTGVATSTSTWDRIRELLPFRAKLLVVVLASGRYEHVLCVMTYAVHELLNVSF